MLAPFVYTLGNKKPASLVRLAGLATMLGYRLNWSIFRLRLHHAKDVLNVLKLSSNLIVFIMERYKLIFSIPNPRLEAIDLLTMAFLDLMDLSLMGGELIRKSPP
jgi:hypothetical protein